MYFYSEPLPSWLVGNILSFALGEFPSCLGHARVLGVLFSSHYPGKILCWLNPHIHCRLACSVSKGPLDNKRQQGVDIGLTSWLLQVLLN